MQEPRFKNVALLPEDHELLRQIADKRTAGYDSSVVGDDSPCTY
jgi:hypothetical protein